MRTKRATILNPYGVRHALRMDGLRTLCGMTPNSGHRHEDPDPQGKNLHCAACQCVVNTGRPIVPRCPCGTRHRPRTVAKHGGCPNGR